MGQYVDRSFQQTPAQKRAGLEQQRRHDEGARSITNMLEFWRFCTKAPCRRAHACMGDSESCLDRHWAMMPQDFKIWFRAAMRAQREGLSPEEADRIGMAEVQRCKELEKEHAPHDGGYGEASPQLTSPASESR